MMNACKTKIKSLMIVFTFIFLIIYPGKAQEKEADDRTFGERLYFGGGLSLQLGNFTYVDVSPLMGYGITQRFSVGIGGTYRYVNDQYFRYKYNVYGGRLFSRFGIFRNVFAHGEYEFLNWENNNRDQQREWYNTAFLGGGYSSHLGAQEGYQIYILFNLFYDQFNSPYNEPYVIRFSVAF